MQMVLIDDHPLALQGIRAILQGQEDMQVVGTASSGEEGIQLLTKCQPDIAMVDLMLPGEFGLDIIKKGRKAAPGCRFVVLTSSANRMDVKQAMAEKVEGYVLKEAMPEEIIAAIRLVSKGRCYIDPVIMQDLMEAEKDDPMSQLTPREMDVLSALVMGMSNREIAESLFVTEYTVKKHVSQILSKLDVSDRTQAALLAAEWGRDKQGKA